ncbi:MAG: HAD family hydrolase [Candidatus Paceibacterota bacterium]|jgi:HAD superfamily hydrolase (TIGR01509 family)
MKTELIIFDFAGTLAFSRMVGFEEFFYGLAETGFELRSQDDAQKIGSIFPQLFGSAASWLDLSKQFAAALAKEPGKTDAEKLAQFFEKALSFKAFSDTKAAMALPIKKAILTAGNHFSVDIPDVAEAEIFTPLETKYLKPDPKAFLFVLDKLGIEPQNAAMVGDEVERDLVPALNLGMKAILIDRENKCLEVPPGIIKISSLEDLKNYLD